MELSIIIPAYNAEPYLSALLNRLATQIRDDVEVIVVDDGSETAVKTNHAFAKVVRQKNGGAGSARNKGIDIANGRYIAFIDADDLVSEDYVSLVLEQTKNDPDYIYLSWKTMEGGWKAGVTLKSVKDEFPPYNLCVWNRIYKKDLIGETRFNTKKAIAEDAEFIRTVQKGPNKAFIGKVVYFYRDTPNSLTKRFSRGEVAMRRVVYHYKHVTKDMTYLIDEFRELDKDAEVILMTDKNELPELSNYAMVVRPGPMKGTELRGEPTKYFMKIKEPIKTQVVIWTEKTYEIGGIETFIYSLCMNLCKYYDIMVLYDKMAPAQIERLIPFVDVRKNGDTPIICDTLIVNRIIDSLPKNVTFKKSVQMVHGVKHSDYHVPQDKDIIVSVSEAVKESFGKETENSVVIRNMVSKPKKKKALLLISTSRLDTADKGEARMLKLAGLMDKAGVNYVWLCFTNKKKPAGAPDKMVYMEPTLNIMSYVAMADYLVQLSDHEAFCYSMVEALQVGTPVIMTPISVLKELGMIDGENGYIVPFDIPTDYDVKKFLNVPTFEYKFDNKESVKRWRKLLGNTKPNGYKPPELVLIKCTAKYYDVELDRTIKPGEEYLVTKERAEIIKGAGYGK